ncbi:MAG TPA: hypothetical protein PKB02_10170 [Anaerohalosphaeraceae bacterium]|nr:hypothetical protein [Anaerohalosphaeraceae bacterium]
MTRKSLVLSLAAMVLAAGLSAQADTFKNKQTGEIFYGFRTLKTTADKTLVYNENEKKLSPIKLDDYEVTLDNNGRRNSVVLVSITDAEALLSQTVTKTICDAITKAANSGPRFVLVKIDCPGGRGEYMKEICSTLTKIDICPTVAYISGGPFGGAHSAAAAIALACDRIYIAPNATMSALGPFVSTSSGHSEMDFLKTYSPDSLATYSVFAATLAENKKRPGILAKALLDKRIGLVEVVDTSGNQTIVQKDALLSNQTVVKILCEGLTPSSTAATDTTTAAVPQPSSVADIHSRVLQLTPADATRFKLADAVADSIRSVLSDMNASDAQLANAPGIDTTIKQFIAAKRNIGLSLSRISFLENRTATLEEQLKTIEEQERTTPVRRSRTINEVGSYTRGRVTIPSSDYYYYYDQSMGADQNIVNTQPITPDNTMSAPNQRTPLVTNPRSRFNRVQGSETVVSNAPALASADVNRELSAVLNNLIGEYRTAVSLANRWVGALPPEITIQTLQRNLESAIALSDNLRFRTQ